MAAGLIRGKVCAITFEERSHASEGDRPIAQTIIGTFTGEVDSWGKHTIQPIDPASGAYYLFADEVLACVRLAAPEVAAELDALRENRYHAGLAALGEALACFEASKTGGMAAAVRGLLREAGR